MRRYGRARVCKALGWVGVGVKPIRASSFTCRLGKAWGAVEHDACHDEHLYASVLRATGGLVLPCAAHLRPTIRRKTTKVKAHLPVSSSFDTLSKELPTRNAEERQNLLEQVLRRHALRVGLCVFQQIFEVLVVVLP